MTFDAEWWTTFGLVGAIMVAAVLLVCVWVHRRAARLEAENRAAAEWRPFDQ